METFLRHVLLPIGACYLLINCMSSFIAFVSSQNIVYTDPDASVIACAIFDLFLVIIFVLQHKLMSTQKFKHFLHFCGVTIVERLIHVAVTSFMLLVLMSFWEPITSVYLWSIDTRERFFLWLFFFLIHTVGWIIMFLDSLAMEPLEMIGLKQIYNYHMELGTPLQYLPKMLQRCYRSVRHPGPVLLVLLLWLHPQMTLDRLILSYFFTWFLWCGYRMTNGQYRQVSRWLYHTREEIVFEQRVPAGRRYEGTDSGFDTEFSD